MEENIDSFIKMKIKIAVEDIKKGKLEIPVSNKELRDVYDAMYMARDGWNTIKLNKCDKSFSYFHRKLEHIIHDVLDDGRVYYEIKTKSGKKKYVLSKKIDFSVKKPRWEK